jgi:outer membrane lipoprotein SlyB
MGFGSLEAALTTTADVALQIALAGGLGRAGAGAAGIINGGLSGAALQKHKTKRQKCQVRGV